MEEEQASVSKAKPSSLYRVPLMDCRHYVGNHLDLFEELISIVYEAGNVAASVGVLPGSTVGQALGMTEQDVATALAPLPSAGAPEPVLFGLLRSIVEDQSSTPGAADFVVDMLNTVLRNPQLPTFAEKADWLAADLQTKVNDFTGLTQAQLDTSIGVFRSVGQLLADLVAFKFPVVQNQRFDIDTNPERYIKVTGSYVAMLPSRAADALSLKVVDDKLKIELAIDSIVIDQNALIDFYKVVEKKDGTEVVKQPLFWNTAVSLGEASTGEFTFRDVTLLLTLADTLEKPTAYSWAPGHDVRRAVWTLAALDVQVGEIDIEVYNTELTVIASFLSMNWGSIAEFESYLEDKLADEIDNAGELFGLAKIAADYLTPVAQRLVPVSHALSRVRYRDPFEGLLPPEWDSLASSTAQRGPVMAVEVASQWDPESHIEFDGLRAYWEEHSVSVRNEQPQLPDLEGVPIDDDWTLHLPDNIGEIDPPGRDWAWPAPGGGLMGIDLATAKGRSVALGFISKAPGLSARTRAIAALAVEGFSSRVIGLLGSQTVDAKAGTVLGRKLATASMTLLLAAQAEAQAQGVEHYVFRSVGFSGQPHLVDSDLQFAQRRIVAMATPFSGAIGSQVWARPFDAGIWTSDYADRSPMQASRGSASDPCWLGLSTNCVVATGLFRKLLAQGELWRSGSVRSGAKTLAYRVNACNDVAADFTGTAPGGAPALALGQLRVGIGSDAAALTEYRLDVRLRLKPRFYSHGCLPDSAVTVVCDELECIEAMTGAAIPLATRLAQLEFRDFVFLSLDVQERARDVQIISLKRVDATPLKLAASVKAQLRDVLAHWFDAVPEVPILYNVFRPLGGEDRDFVAKDGWLTLYRHYGLPDFSGLALG